MTPHLRPELGELKPGTPCRSPRGRVVPLGVHPSRADAWISHQHAA